MIEAKRDILRIRTEPQWMGDENCSLVEFATRIRDVVKPDDLDFFGLFQAAVLYRIATDERFAAGERLTSFDMMALARLATGLT